MLFAKDMMAKIAFVTDVIVNYVSVADGDHILEIINQYVLDRW